MNGTACNLEQIIELEYYDLFTLEDALNHVLLRHGLELRSQEGKISYVLDNGMQSIPTSFSGFMLDAPDKIKLEIILGSGIESEYTLLLRSKSPYYLNARELLPILACEIKEYIKKTPPATFVSMEHLTNYFGINCRVILKEVSESLVWPVLKAAEEMFSDYEDHQELLFRDDPDYEPSVLKIVDRNGQAQLMNINSFKVKTLNGVTLALGMKHDQSIPLSPYELTVFAAHEHLNEVYERYKSCFDRLLIEGSEIRGGKYTGLMESISAPVQADFSDLVLDEAVEVSIQKEIFDFFRLESYYRQAGLPFKRGVVLYGPPGTGKTSLSRAILSQASETVIWVKPGDLRRAQDLERIFWLARIGKPSIIIMEDVDLYLEDRNYHRGNDQVLADVLNHLDGLSDNDGILVIMSTNRVEVLETAIVNRPGRIDTKINLGELKADKIACLMSKRLGNFPRNFDNFSDLIPPRTTLTGAMSVELCTMVLKRAVESSLDKEFMIQADYVADALREIEPVNRRVVGFNA